MKKPFYPALEPYNFGGLEEEDYKKAKVVILPVPYEGTVSYGTGTSKGPNAIISASRQVELFDIELQKETYKKTPIFTLPFLQPSVNSVLEMLQRVEKVVGDILKDNKFPLIIGGEHSISWGAINAFTPLEVNGLTKNHKTNRPLTGFKKKYKNFKNFSVLQLDAHTDLRDEFESSKYSYAAVIRRVKDLGLNVTAVGIRSMSKEEADYIKQKKLKNIFLAPALPIDKIIDSLAKNVYLTFDLDVFDPSIMPSVGTPEPGGLGWYEVLSLIKKVAQKRKIVGADIVELSPIPGITSPDFLAAKLIYKIIGYIFR